MIDYLILILLLVVIVVLFWLGCRYATINTTEQWQESVLKNYELGYEEVIDKACEWLKNDFEELTRLHLDDIVIDKFRKAMKGE